MNIKEKYCGYITIVGKANVGKSTLLNQIIGKKISIVSRKKNTTQTNITGIKTKENYQSIYIDTPGFIFDEKNNAIIHKKHHCFHVIKNSALIIFVLDRIFWTKNDEIILNQVQKNGIPIIIIINKIDKISNKNILLPFLDFLKKKKNIKEIIPICAKKTKYITLLQNIIKCYLPKNFHIYSKNDTTTNSDLFIISEIIRKQLILSLGDELPSIIRVETEYFQKTKNNQWHIKAIILVKNIRQKKIIIGRNGAKIKNISMISRNNIEKELHIKTHLFLWVKQNISKTK